MPQDQILEVWGEFACFTRPELKVERFSYPVITPSAATAQDVCDTFQMPQERIRVIPHGVDASFSPKMEARDHGVRSRLKLPKRFALFVGTLEPRKNLLGLIEGIKRYREESHDDLELVLAGKWGWKSTQLRHRLFKGDVRSWVHTPGYVPAQDKPALYRSASVFTWPSIYEGFGLPVLEAMASGIPVITTRTSSLPELTANAAILVDPYNTTDITDALHQLMRSHPLQQSLKKRALERTATFSWRNTASQTLQTFHHYAPSQPS